MAGSVNKVILVGNLGADPEIRRMGSGDAVASFSIATSESWRDRNTGERRDRTEWHNIVIFNEGLVKIAEQYLKKGSKIYIEGQLQTRKWQDKNGIDRYTTEVVLQKFRGELHMLDSRGDNVGGRQQFDNQSQNYGGGYGDSLGGNNFGGRNGQNGSDQNSGFGDNDASSNDFSRDLNDEVPF